MFVVVVKASRAKRRRSATGFQSGSKTLSDTTWFFIILGCAFLLRLIYLFQIESIPLFYHLAGDGQTYDEWGQRIAAGDWFGKGVFYQAPLYPYFLGILQTSFGHNLWLIRVTQITLGAISCALIFLVGRKLFSQNAGIASGLILTCYAPALFFDGLIEKSILDLFLLSVLLVFLGRATEGQRWSQWLAIGAILSLLGLSRENALILALVIPVWIGFHFSQQPIQTRLKWIGLFFAGMLLILLPVGLRNLTVGGELTLTTSQFGPNFFIGNNPAADGTYGSIRTVIGEIQLEGRDAERLAERAVGRDLTAGEVSDFWLRKALEYIRSEPAKWIGLFGRKWLMVWNAREVEDSDDFYIYGHWSWLLSVLAWFGNFGVLAPLAAAGLWFTHAQWRRLWLLYVMILALAASVALFYIFGRYRYPLVPLLALFAGAAVAELWRIYRERNWQALLAPLSILILSAAVVNWPMYGARGPGAGGYNNLANSFYKQGKVGDAIRSALKAIEMEPEYGIAHYNLGNLYAGQGKYDLAQRHFQEALRIYPNYADAQSNFGQLLAERGEIETGIQYFRRAIELNPELSRAHLNLGVALAKQGRTEDAVRPLQEAVRLAPDSVEYHYYLGSVYAELGRFDEAERAFNDALVVRSDFAPAHQSLAQLLSLQGKKEEAMQHYQEALRLMKRTRGPTSVQ